LITQQQTEEKELTMNKSPRALALEAHPFDPACLTVAGDATTPNGQRYVDSFLNDYRNPNMVSWSPAHEALVLSLVQTARPADNMPIAVNVPVGEPDGVVLMTTTDGVDVLVEDGRQRRRSSVVFNARLRWIADVFMTQLLSTDAPTIEDLKQRLLDFGPDGESPAVYSEGGDDTILPPAICSGSYDAPALQPGDIIAPWLTRGFVEAITSSTTPFFTEEGEAIPLYLRLDVRGEDIDLSDPTLLLHNILRKESVIPTPRAVKAQQRRVRQVYVFAAHIEAQKQQDCFASFGEERSRRRDRLDEALGQPRRDDVAGLTRYSVEAVDQSVRAEVTAAELRGQVLRVRALGKDCGRLAVWSVLNQLLFQGFSGRNSQRVLEKDPRDPLQPLVDDDGAATTLPPVFDEDVDVECLRPLLKEVLV
jgi:hypothetical protein